MTTRRDFVKSAGAAVVAGVVGFPVRNLIRTDALPGSLAPGLLPTLGKTSSVVASNGYLSSLLSPADLLALRKINVSMTQLAVQQCERDDVANQILFDPAFLARWRSQEIVLVNLTRWIPDRPMLRKQVCGPSVAVARGGDVELSNDILGGTVDKIVGLDKTSCWPVGVFASGGNGNRNVH